MRVSRYADAAKGRIRFFHWPLQAGLAYTDRMRWPIRILLFWALAAPAFYIWGMPYLTDYTEAKTREQTFHSCKQQIEDQHLQISAEQGDRYCTCINDGLNFEDGDLINMASTHEAPERVRQQLEAQITICGDQLARELQQQPVSAPVPAPAAPAVPAVPNTPVTKPDGSVEIYL